MLRTIRGERPMVGGVPEEIEDQGLREPVARGGVEAGIVPLNIRPIRACSIFQLLRYLDIHAAGFGPGDVPVDRVVGVPVGLQESERQADDGPDATESAADTKAPTYLGRVLPPCVGWMGVGILSHEKWQCRFPKRALDGPHESGLISQDHAAAKGAAGGRGLFFHVDKTFIDAAAGGARLPRD